MNPIVLGVAFCVPAAFSKFCAASMVRGSAVIAATTSALSVKVVHPIAANLPTSSAVRTEATSRRVQEDMPLRICCISPTWAIPSLPLSFMRPKYGAAYSAPTATLDTAWCAE
eukprot:CAMPEP_0179447232 /NCGR_PEP_ID=MMETSP0799-20121207/31081_1 /TAXON_ID=46947 /ORGANISM="Geminigera cryophila, Strain CCMP2564" /LENGTH=112 /DNA_ID=CAMNT_0021237875 /DNA_START=334 /DNA_END=672 /DNA_ORIENTATION=+